MDVTLEEAAQMDSHLEQQIWPPAPAFVDEWLALDDAAEVHFQAIRPNIATFYVGSDIYDWGGRGRGSGGGGGDGGGRGHMATSLTN